MRKTILSLTVRFSLFLPLAAALSTASAQDTLNTIGNVSIASPTAASLGKYGDIPVSYHTGVPDITIPLYTVAAGPLKMPVSISYHASGLKVQEPAGWAGAGFALNAGGVITRTVVGGPDEKGTNTGSTETKGHFSDYGYNSYLYAYYGNQTVQEDWINFARGFKDGEPDLYFFNFGGFSGKFYFRDDRTPVCVPEQDLKIVPDYDGAGTTGIIGFTITTPDGAKYSFGNTGVASGAVQPVETTSPLTSQGGLANATAISSWYLNGISSADNLFNISLSYTPENYGYFTLSMFPLDGVLTDPNKQFEYTLVKNIVNGVRLSQVSFPNGTLDFIGGTVRTDLSDGSPTLTDNVNTQAKTLGSVQVTDNNGFCKKFDFTYSYFTDNSTAPLSGDLPNMSAATLSTDRQRLRLDQVQESSCDASATVTPYTFTYFAEPVPRRLSFGIDHWGFYNGHDDNQTLIPTYTISSALNPQTVQGATRDASWPEMRGGALQQVAYPTGGYSRFDFEPNNVHATYTNYINGSLLNLVAHQYGQSNLSQSLTFTVTGSGPQACPVTATNGSSNWAPTFSITDANGAQQGTSPWQVAPSSTFTSTLTLPPGTYTATLAFPSNSIATLAGGATANVSQWQYVQVSATKTVGGLRIKTITNNDGATANDVVTNYSYETNHNGVSTAVLYSRPVYVGIIRNDLIRDIGYWTVNGFLPFLSGNGCPSALSASYFKSPSSIQPMATTQGYHIGYSHVEVSQTGNGRSTYDYYGNPPYQNTTGDVAITLVNTDGCDANAPNYPPAPLPFDYMRGELKYEARYDQSGNLLSDAAHTPVYGGNAMASTPAFIVKWQGSQLLATKYSLTTAHKLKDQTVQTSYTPNIGSAATTTVIYYASAFHRQPTRKVTFTSKGDSLATNMVYAQDFRVAACDAIPDGYVQLVQDCSNCRAAYTTTVQQCASNLCVTNAFLALQQCHANARVAYVGYQQLNFTNPINSFQTAHDYAKSSADAELKPILELQDEYGDPVIETSHWKNTGLLGAAYTRYGYVANPSGYVYPSMSRSIDLRFVSNTFAPATVSGNTINKDSRYTDEATFLFDGGNLVETTQRNGITTSYIWGHNNMLPIAKAVGSTFASLRSAYTAAGGNLYQLRSQPALSGALVSTYNHSPLVGITAQTDPAGHTVYNEYDSLGRLKTVRDQDGNVLKTCDYQYQK